MQRPCCFSYVYGFSKMKFEWAKKKFWPAVLFGGLIAFAFPPFFIAPIFFLSYAWLYRNTNIKNAKRVFFDSCIFFTSFFVALLYWLVNPLTFDLRHHAILIPFAVLIAPAFLSIQFAAMIWLAKKYFWENSIARIFSFYQHPSC